jgi:hypothetical protein
MYSGMIGRFVNCEWGRCGRCRDVFKVLSLHLPGKGKSRKTMKTVRIADLRGEI